MAAGSLQVGGHRLDERSVLSVPTPPVRNSVSRRESGWVVEAEDAEKFLVGMKAMDDFVADKHVRRAARANLPAEAEDFIEGNAAGLASRGHGPPRPGIGQRPSRAAVHETSRMVPAARGISAWRRSTVSNRDAGPEGERRKHAPSHAAATGHPHGY